MKDYKHILKLNLNGHSIIIAKSNDIEEMKKIEAETKKWIEQVINEKHEASTEIKTAEGDSLYRFYNE